MWKGAVPSEFNYLGEGLETKREDHLTLKACVGKCGQLRFAR